MAEEDDNQISQLIAYNDIPSIRLLNQGRNVVQGQVSLAFPNNKTTNQNLLQILFDGDTKEYMDQKVNDITIVLDGVAFTGYKTFNEIAYVLSKFYNSKYRDDDAAFANIIPPKYKDKDTSAQQNQPIIILINFGMINKDNIFKQKNFKDKIEKGFQEDSKEELEFDNQPDEEFDLFVDSVAGQDFYSSKKIKDRYKKFTEAFEEEEGEELPEEQQEEEEVTVKRRKPRKRKAKRKRFTKRVGKGIDFDKYKLHLINLTSYTGDNKIYNLGNNIKNNIDNLKHYAAYRN
jgi:hypothetical protein